MARRKRRRPRKPVIGITCEVSKLRPHYSEFELSCDYRYVRSIIRAGGIPVLLPIIPFEKDVKRLVKSLDGVVITGGADIHPSFYGEKPSDKVSTVYRGRIYFEKLLFHAAQKKKIPIFAICYGLQLLNVLSGGTLFQDIQSEIRGSRNHRSKRIPLHRVDTVEGSLLRKTVRKKSFLVYSEHHQAVKKTGQGITITAFSEDGIPEAIQGPARTLAVQWHPERQPKDPVQRKLFAHFIRMAQSRATTHPSL